MDPGFSGLLGPWELDIFAIVVSELNEEEETKGQDWGLSSDECVLGWVFNQQTLKGNRAARTKPYNLLFSSTVKNAEKSSGVCHRERGGIA